MIKVSEIAHFYLGAKFLYLFWDGRKIESEVCNISPHGFMCGYSEKKEIETGDGYFEINNIHTCGEMTLFLKHPSHMTEYEKSCYYRLCKKITYKSGRINCEMIVDTPESLSYLYLNHFDVFGLIESGGAIFLDNEMIIT